MLKLLPVACEDHYGNKYLYLSLPDTTLLRQAGRNQRYKVLEINNEVKVKVP